MQVSIDSAKKSYDMDLMEEINRLKILIDIDHNKYPAFWLSIRKGFNKNKINWDLECPMNYLYNIKISRVNKNEKIMELKDFFKPFDLTPHMRRKPTKRIEMLINKYSLKLYDDIQSKMDDIHDYYDEILILRDDFDNLIEDLRATDISRNYLGFISFLLNRGFGITVRTKAHQHRMNTKTYKNRSILLKVLYELNPEALLECFSKNKENKRKQIEQM